MSSLHEENLMKADVGQFRWLEVGRSEHKTALSQKQKEWTYPVIPGSHGFIRDCLSTDLPPKLGAH